MVFNTLTEKRKEIADFLNDKFGIVIDKYSDIELNDLLIKIISLLDKRLNIEETKYFDLKKKLENEKMLVESIN